MSTGKDEIYYSEKIPFVWNYSDNDRIVEQLGARPNTHGTHVAGIVGANAGLTRGTAPDAQLALMKVGYDGSGGIADSVVLAALDDAVALGVDAINMSFGIPAGYYDPADTVYEKIMRNLAAKGITVNAAAGNEFSSAQGNQSGMNLPYVTDPDVSSLSAPASFTGNISVASFEAMDSLPPDIKSETMSEFSSWASPPTCV